MSADIRPFKPRSSHPAWRDRFLAAVLYLLLGYLLKDSFGSDIGLTVSIVLVILYWVFIHRGVIKLDRFLRFHYLQATILFTFLFIAVRIAALLLAALASTAGLAGVRIFDPLFIGYLSIGCTYLFLAVGISQAVVAVLGKTPRIPWVTSNVNYWA